MEIIDYILQNPKKISLLVLFATSTGVLLRYVINSNIKEIERLRARIKQLEGEVKELNALRHTEMQNIVDLFKSEIAKTNELFRRKND